MKWLVVAVLWGVALLNYLDRQVVFSLLPLLEKDLHASPFQLGFISSVFLWTYGLFSPLGGFIADRLGRARVILISLAIWTTATWLTAHITTMPHMLALRALMGISEAFYLPAALALIADLHPSETRSLATGLHQSGLYTGLILGGAWGGWMGDHSTWRNAFSILGITGIVYLAIVAITLGWKRPSATKPATLTAASELFVLPGFPLVVVAFTAMAIANFLVYTWLPLFLHDRFHLSLTNAGFSATFYLQAASYFGVIAGGIATDRWAQSNPDARAWMQIAGLALAAPFLALLGLANSMPVLIAALITFGLGRGIFDCTTMPLLRRITGSERSATGYGILNCAACLTSGFATAAAGYMKQTIGLSAAFELAALILLSGALVLLKLTSDKLPKCSSVR